MSVGAEASDHGVDRGRSPGRSPHKAEQAAATSVGAGKRRVSAGAYRDKLWSSDSDLGEAEYDAIFGDVIEMDWDRPHDHTPLPDYTPLSQPPQCVEKDHDPAVSITPAPPTSEGGGVLLLSNNVTPTPDYRKMCTPQLKDRCARFGVRALPKRKMIAKLKEIYTYTHPLVGKWVGSRIFAVPVCSCSR